MEGAKKEKGKTEGEILDKQQKSEDTQQSVVTKIPVEKSHNNNKYSNCTKM